MSKPKTVIIFDLDETLTKRNLPVIISELWIKDSRLRFFVHIALEFCIRKLTVRPFRRKLEYIISAFISDDFIEKSMIKILSDGNEINQNAIRRLQKYKFLGYKVMIISAGPAKTTAAFANYLGVEYISSRVNFGIITADLLGKKEKTYKSIHSSGMNIRSIYSDSVLDFSPLARRNMLVKNSKIECFKK